MVDAKVFFKPDFVLVTSGSQYAIYREGSKEYTGIRRDSGKISQNEVVGAIPKGQECFGVMGIVDLSASKYLILITEASFIGNIKDSKIFRVERCDFLPFVSASTLSSHIGKFVDSQYISMFAEVIDSKSFYFSYTYDLTHSLQRISEFTDQEKATPRVMRAEQRFIWNAHFVEDLVHSDALEVIVPVISGFVQIECAQFGGHEVEFALISRRDHRRAGVRFQTRGLDGDGNAANFVETEQILMLHQNNRFVAASFVQIRGSIPLRWHQKPNLKWAPQGFIYGTPQQNLESAEKHFAESISSYGDLFLINLIDKKGNQKEIGTALKNQLDSMKYKRLKLTWFDFHHECRGLHWEHIAKLMREIEPQIDQYSYFRCTTESNADWGEELVNEKQTGIFRTNCMDCLDRTNVVQSVLARSVLHRQLYILGLAGKPNGEVFQPLPEPLEFCFRSFWANNADVISELYAGTGALKVDFTRTGKRTKAGALSDGRNSLHRYFINNFYDGYRKNSVDAFLGKISPLSKVQPPSNRHLPMVRFTLICILALIVVHVAGAASGDSWLTYLFGAGLALALIQKGMVVNGRSLVDKPVVEG